MDSRRETHLKRACNHACGEDMEVILALSKIGRTTIVRSSFPIDVHRQIKPFFSWTGLSISKLRAVQSSEFGKNVKWMRPSRNFRNVNCPEFGVRKEHKMGMTIEGSHF